MKRQIKDIMEKKVTVFTLILIGTFVYLPICITQFILFYNFSTSLPAYSVVSAPSNPHSQVPKLYQSYQNTSISFLRGIQAVTLGAPVVTIVIFIICLLFVICYRLSLSKERYLSIFSFSNPHAMMISMYHKTQYDFTSNDWKQSLKNCGGMLLITLSLLVYASYNLVDTVLQVREIYIYQHGQSDFYDLNYQLIYQINADLNYSSYNNCRIDQKNDQTTPTINSPYCQITAAQLIKSLQEDRQFYDNFVLTNNFTIKSVVYLVLKVSFVVYSALSTIISLLGVIFCGCCVVAFYTREENTYVSHTVFAKRKKQIPITEIPLSSL